ncbi:MAG TPA: cation diffusion facilitator family transporter, partial [bacterium]|nr:cation diffusion facilitator family transporter [bacterium]
MHEHSNPSKEFPCEAPAGRPSAAACALEQRRLVIAIVITGLTMLLEVAGGLLSGSLALLSDAGHMFSHLFALAVAYFAILISCRPPTEAQSFGFYRAEILAAMVNGFSLLIVVAWILYEAWVRLMNPAGIAGAQMLVVAAIGLVVNAVTALLLRGASHQDINIRGAFIHVLGDLFSSVGVVAAAAVISLTGWTAIDPIVSAGIALVILYWAAKLLWDAARILLQSTPRDITHEKISEALSGEIAEIRGVHHIHVW